MKECKVCSAWATSKAHAGALHNSPAPIGDQSRFDELIWYNENDTLLKNSAKLIRYHKTRMVCQEIHASLHEQIFKVEMHDDGIGLHFEVIQLRQQLITWNKNMLEFALRLSFQTLRLS